MTLYTSRLTLSSFEPDDWPFFLQLRRNGNVMRYMGEIASEEHIRTLFDDRLADRHAFIIRNERHASVGDIGLRISHHNPQEADVGYSITPAAQGQGIASEALQALCNYAFDSKVQALNAWVLAENQGSVKVLEKSGFQRVQVLEKAYLLHGEYHDDWIYRREKA
ncbi:Protein N-acetyltransferase, RimJ/RimL family [Kosakonia arachidis]|uniref:Protein N-acetyltransferase, RimJ/RimL family n=1 Tax=Kosakonia arachidis TaxID=551989 RepID=A0A1I7CUE4_9ENTR|nr:GNAT family N-acetyltransferase [Kosakonia arachidis]SFU03048.1 Protein N-acetyltransferase, RimJ/RimL family [Kosakonia arachidis]